ncbi:hypothetical protein FOCC_FOCC008945 [Frankliniella occidentalis]|nr:hypothetical protein FOCC_FOCC008945 [Frankliniella occidentalis]
MGLVDAKAQAVPPPSAALPVGREHALHLKKFWLAGRCRKVLAVLTSSQINKLITHGALYERFSPCGIEHQHQQNRPELIFKTKEFHPLPLRQSDLFNDHLGSKVNTIFKTDQKEWKGKELGSQKKKRISQGYILAPFATAGDSIAPTSATKEDEETDSPVYPAGLSSTATVMKTKGANRACRGQSSRSPNRMQKARTETISTLKKLIPLIQVIWTWKIKDRRDLVQDLRFWGVRTAFGYTTMKHHVFTYYY